MSSKLRIFLKLCSVQSLVVTSNYVSGRIPHIFPEPERFIPERWSRENEEKPPTFSSLPFGFGPRMCVGQCCMSIYSHIDCQMIGISCGYINYMYCSQFSKCLVLPETNFVRLMTHHIAPCPFIVLLRTSVQMSLAVICLGGRVLQGRWVILTYNVYQH